MNDLIINENIKIEDLIYVIRGKQVMLDSDLAKLYHVETKRVNEAVKNNPNKFPERFAFRITEDEYLNLKSKFSTSNLENNYGGSRKGHSVFTEQGVYMLATILKTKIATEVTLKIMDTFVLMKKYISNNLLEQKYYNDMTIRHDSEIKILQETFNSFKSEKEVNEIYFDGKIWDAYSKILDIFNEAKNSLIIIDRYTDKSILDIIKNLTCKVILITSKNTKLTKLDIDKYNSTYNNLDVYYDETFHDRYFIIDNTKIYHSGNSINHIGFRKSSIDILGDINIINTILNNVEIITK